MHPSSLLQRWLKRNWDFMHRARQGAEVCAVGALLAGKTLTLTHLGRHLPGRLHTKHKINGIDRLLGNWRLHDERIRVYEELARWLVGSIERPVIIVDR